MTNCVFLYQFSAKFLEYIQERGGDVIHTENGEPGLFIPFNLGVVGSEEDEEEDEKGLEEDESLEPQIIINSVTGAGSAPLKSSILNGGSSKSSNHQNHATNGHANNNTGRS